MRCFVIDGVGFIGSHLVDRLIAEGSQVTVFDNLSSRKKEFMEQHIGRDNFKLYVNFIQCSASYALNSNHAPCYFGEKIDQRPHENLYKTY